MRTVIQLLIFSAAIWATVPASAELYKWVDERGVTNYSNAPPPAAATANKLTRVENKISVYTPDESFMQAVKAWREGRIKTLSEPERPASPVASLSTPSQSGYEQCLLSGRLGCDDLYRSYYPSYLLGGVGLPLRRVLPTGFLTPHSRPARTHAGHASSAR